MRLVIGVKMLVRFHRKNLRQKSLQIREVRESARAAIREMLMPIGDGYKAFMELLKQVAEQLNEYYENVQKMMRDNEYLNEIKGKIGNFFAKIY
jgi:hypothetical protein